MARTVCQCEIVVIISSTRDSRLGEKPAQWILDKANALDGITAELVVLKHFDLPFFKRNGVQYVDAFE
ncbi:MAG: NAD(P)H-dependent oxidoreductase [Candidatus Devosia symbiotica]|nr:NAD(P)H-dependent oxidoreductase [Candidatus Devosia symbiotica]